MLQRQLSVDFKKGCVSVCFIFLLSLVYSLTIVSCVKVCLNDSYNKVPDWKIYIYIYTHIYIYVYMSVSLPDTYGVKPADALSPVHFTLLENMPPGGFV